MVKPDAARASERHRKKKKIGKGRKGGGGEKGEINCTLRNTAEAGAAVMRWDAARLETRATQTGAALASDSATSVCTSCFYFTFVGLSELDSASSKLPCNLMAFPTTINFYPHLGGLGVVNFKVSSS